MPFDHSYEAQSDLLIARGTGEGSILETVDSARRLLGDPHLPSARGLMIVVDDTALNPTAAEMETIAQVLRYLKARMSGRVAIVVSRAGVVTRAQLIAALASERAGDAQAFLSEAEARAWLCGDTRLPVQADTPSL